MGNRIMNLKMKKIAIAIIVCYVSILNISIALETEKANKTFSFFSNISANGENGGSIDNTKQCITNVTSNEMWQICNGVEMLIRVEIAYSCDGNLLGQCYTGSEYYFFDCDGSVISEQDKKEISFCK